MTEAPTPARPPRAPDTAPSARPDPAASRPGKTRFGLLRTLRLQLRFLAPLALVLVVVAYVALPLVDRMTLRWFQRDLDSRAAVVANALSDSVVEDIRRQHPELLQPLFERALQDERLLAIGLCSPDGRMLVSTPAFPRELDCDTALVLSTRPDPRLLVPGGPVHVAMHDVYYQPAPPPPPDSAGSAASAAEATPGASGASGDASAASEAAPAASGTVSTVPSAEGLPEAASGVLPAASAPAPQMGPPAPVLVARLVLLHDLSFIAKRSRDTRNYMIGLFTVLGMLMALITVVVAQLSWRGWVEGVRAVLRGEGLVSPMTVSPLPELESFAADVRERLRQLEDDWSRLQGSEADWTPDRLRALLRTQLRGDQVIVVSNREPYEHVRAADGQVTVVRPASGLVTAVEPVMRACSGTWIAHGSGSADRDTVDAHDRVRVPPGHDDYLLRRLWLSDEEVAAYYLGFANEGLWPLCHVAHVRPVFRESDWQAYRAINQRFADAVVAEARGDDPIVLVQDYHFALLPAMLRERLPQATILTFWHIPWPNPESFGICPWRREILEGLLGSTIVGFHTRFHCHNFIETVDRFLEARISREQSSISFREDETLVEAYPISIEWPTPEMRAAWPPVDVCRRTVRERFGLAPDTVLAVGVDRFDYTKGIPERLNAVERMLEKYPQWRGRFVFLQVAAPTRSSLEEYQLLKNRVEHACERLNTGTGRPDWRPVILLERHHDANQINELFRAADVCVVTSLHDGMNLVCKEFVAARDDERGVLVLSRFAGAASELTEALIVNPYHVEETADALHRAASMPPEEQRERMAALRSTVREFNVYRWAGRMLSQASRWRLKARVHARVRRLRSSGGRQP